MLCVQKAWLFLTDLHGKLRGKLIPLSSDGEVNKCKTEFAGVFAGDVLDRFIPEVKMVERPVIVAVPASSGIPSPWHSSETYHMCNGYVDEQGTIPSKLCCRTLLSDAIEELREVGFEMKNGTELEWTLMKDGKPVCDVLSTYSTKPWHNAHIDAFMSALVDHTSHFPVTIEALHAEHGQSIFETALSPADPLCAADAVQLYRMTIKKMAKDYDMQATFVPKPFPDSAGCGLHIHISLSKIKDAGDATDVLFSSFLGGLLHHMYSSTVILLPNKNSFERIHSAGFWTSNAVSYGVDSRTSAIRLVNYGSTTGNARIELRMAGGDANPYLCLLYCIRAGLWGIRHKVDISTFGEPGQIIRRLPSSLREASVHFLDDQSPARELYGNDFVDVYGQQRLHEARITDALPRQRKWEQDVF